MKKLLGIIILIAGVVIGGYLFKDNVSFGGGDGFTAFECSVQSSSQVVIGDDVATEVFAGHSRTAYARITVNSTSTQDVHLSFDEGANAVVGQGVHISATTTPFVEFGLNTDFPYVGAVTAITPTATTTVELTTCRYNR